MRASARRFPYEKAVVLNVIYDALDALGFRIDESNSMRGTLLVSLQASANDKMRIVISPSLREETSLVEIFPLCESSKNDELINAMFDEMDALIQRAGIEAAR